MRLFALASALLLAACSAQEDAMAPLADIVAAPAFIAEGRPASLSDWGQLERTGGVVRPAGGVVVYELNSPLFTDYAGKMRTIWMPEGAQAVYREGDVLDFPIGTVITKTFFYERAGGGTVRPGPEGALAIDQGAHRLMETRVLARRETGWIALPYVWDEDGMEARLQRTGAVEALSLIGASGARQDFAYLVPNANQCAACHAPDSNTRALSPIGPKPRHLNMDFDAGDGARNQLQTLVAMGYLDRAPAPEDMPRNAVWTDESASLESRARAYLDINCSHCHSPVGPADTSGLDLEPGVPHGPSLGFCKPPIAAGAGSGGRLVSIQPGEADASILAYRMESDVPDVMMPEIGRSLVHAEGAALIRAWIDALEPGCGA